MSQPEPDLERQKRRHAGPLIGIAAVLIFVAVILTWMFGETATEGQPPAGAETQIDGRTGEEEPSGGTVGGSQSTPDTAVTPPAASSENPEDAPASTIAPTSPPDAATPPAGSTSP